MTATPSAEDAVHRLIEAATTGDIPTLLSTLLPESLLGVQGLRLQEIGPLQSYEVSERGQEAGQEIFVLRLHAEQELSIRLVWREVAGQWKVAAASRVEAADAAPAPPFPVDLSWLEAKTEWGIRPRIGAEGLTIEAINVGSYGVVPDRGEAGTQRPCGAQPAIGAPRMGYSIFDKAEVWSPIAGALYEEAIQRRWSPATQIPWRELQPLPDEVERALCQLCTSLSERQFVANDVPARWESRIAYDFHEVKLMLATQIFDAARHIEVFRKRALANGGGLGVQSPGYAQRAVIEAQGFAEMSLFLHVLVAGQTQLWLRAGEAAAPSEVEKRIFRLSLQDITRQLAYGVSHLRFLLAQRPDRAPELHRYLDKGEGMLAADDERDLPLNEALALLLGGGRKGAARGLARWQALKRQGVIEYLRRLDYAGLTERRPRLDPRLARYLDS